MCGCCCSDIDYDDDGTCCSRTHDENDIYSFNELDGEKLFRTYRVVKKFLEKPFISFNF